MKILQKTFLDADPEDKRHVKRLKRSADEMIWSLILMYYIHITVITSKEKFRSAYFLSSENKRLPGQVFKQMHSSSFMLCNQACLKHSARCASTNFIKFNEETDEGHCELNEEEPRSSVYDDIKLTDQPGTTFTMFLQVRSLADKMEEFSSNLMFDMLVKLHGILNKATTINRSFKDTTSCQNRIKLFLD